ncbi:DUF3990 domain-containing protein [Clostridium sp.]|uniref:DUF3990 domain-containing protein n=1 Tax=Clostridium sp. TaxID=1506 RepID=UPI00307850CA
MLAYCFQGASVEWLHFVAENRKKDLFPQLLKKYGTIDIIGGKIADDQTAHTLQQYIGGVDFGIPGTPKADKIAIEKLLPNRRDTNVATVVQKHPILQFNHTDTPRFFNKVSTS